MRFIDRLCNCPHAPKHHKRSGRCRKGCECPRAMLKVEWKKRRAQAKGMVSQ